MPPDHPPNFPPPRPAIFRESPAPQNSPDIVQEKPIVGVPVTLRFEVDEGLNRNLFVQSPVQSSHAVITTVERPRVLVTFPAGNSGVGLWFDPRLPENQGLRLDAGAPLQVDAEGTVHLSLTFSSPQAVLSTVVLDSIRTLRDVGTPSGDKPRRLRQEMAARFNAPADWAEPTVRIQGNVVEFHRHELNGQEYWARLILSAEAHIEQQGSALRFQAPTNLTMQVEAHVPFKPLSPRSLDHLVRPEVLRHFEAVRSTDEFPRFRRSLQDLQMLAYHEKYLAGSWRFETYFGRDTLLTLSMLSDVLTAPAYLDGIRSVLGRLSPDGRVAHEEDVGSWAEFRHLEQVKKGIPPPSDWESPVYDYKMVDSDFLLPIALARLRGAPELRVFMADAANRRALQRNAQRILSAVSQPLVRILPGEKVGDWRDSTIGLGKGVYPGSVNVDLVSAALDALDRLGLGSAPVLVKQRWARTARHFEVRLGSAELRQRVQAYLQTRDPAEQAAFRRQPLETGTTVGDFLDGGDVPILRDGLRFWALSLNEDASPVAVENSDGAFRLLFADPSEEDVKDIVKLASLPFPLGLMTPAGMVVANPATSTDPELWQKLNRDAYHGTVIWGWQHNMLALGLMRQMHRFQDRPEMTGPMQSLLDKLAAAEKRAGPLSHSELWTYEIRENEVEPVAFGVREEAHDESNPVQLWSAAYPAVSLARSRLPRGSKGVDGR